MGLDSWRRCSRFGCHVPDCPADGGRRESCVCLCQEAAVSLRPSPTAHSRLLTGATPPLLRSWTRSSSVGTSAASCVERVSDRRTDGSSLLLSGGWLVQLELLFQRRMP